jgi:LysR family transcriptional regulator, carnitine catabolism transcriptional activator
MTYKKLMDLHQLEAAVAVAEHGNFTRAAGELHLTQPALSYAIANLEAELGVELFHRGGRIVSVTTSGEAFLAGARETLRGADRLRATMAEISGVVSGRLEVATPRTLVRRMALYVGEFRKAHPGVIVQLDDAEGDEAVLDALRRGDCELALMRRPELPADVEGDALAPEEFAAVFPQGTSLGSGHQLSLRQLAQHPLVAPPRGTANRAAFEQLFRNVGVSVTVVVESAHPESILELVCAGAGASLASRHEAEALLTRGIVVRRFRPSIKQVVYLTRRRSRLSPAAAAFRNLILATRS